MHAAARHLTRGPQCPRWMQYSSDRNLISSSHFEVIFAQKKYMVNRILFLFPFKKTNL